MQIKIAVFVVVVVVTFIMFVCVWRQSVEYDSFFFAGEVLRPFRRITNLLAF